MTGHNAIANLGSAVVGRVPPRLVQTLPSRRRERALLLLNRALKRKPRTFHRVGTAGGFVISGNTSDLIQRYLYLFGVWEPSITRWVSAHLRPGDVVVDIGANIGYFSLLAASKVAPGGRVLAFEPVPSIADMLESNIGDNGLPVEVFRLALGQADGEIEIFRAAGINIGASGTTPVGDAISEGKVRCARAADVIPRDLWGRIRFIKIDVEGDEAGVLAGLHPVLDALPDGSAVQVEINPDALAARDTSAAAVMETMAEHGFRALAIHNSYHPEEYAAGVVHEPQPLLTTPTQQTDAIFVKQRT